MSHRPPYHSQWSDPDWNLPIVEQGVDPCLDPVWSKHGFNSPEEYRFWARRSCGLACLESVLDFCNITRPSRFLLLQAALRWGVYRVGPDRSVFGLIHQPFVEWLEKDFSIPARAVAHQNMTSFLNQIPSAGLALASVSQYIRRPDRPRVSSFNGGHLVLVIEQCAGDILFHNSSGVPPYQSLAKLNSATFASYFAGRGIVLERPQTCGQPTSP